MNTKTMTPKRIQLSRKKGWKMPPNTLSVARPGPWGNPFKVGKNLSAAESVWLYRQWMTEPGRAAGDRKRTMKPTKPQPQGWQSVRDGLPPLYTHVLIHMPRDFPVPVWAWIGYHDGKCWRTHDAGRICCKVTHWQHLPEPPEAK
jgi:hypothetical protein